MVNSAVPEEIYYRLAWRARSSLPGGHMTRTSGGSTDFRGYVPFLQSPDPRRLDLRAGARTIPHKLMVRAFYERGAVNVYAVVDLSASMGFVGAGEKYRLMADAVTSIAWSSIRNGDNFGLIACDDTLRADMFMPPSHRRDIVAEIRKRFSRARPAAGTGVRALPRAAEQLRQRRALVFLISDFHLDTAVLRQTLVSMASHDIVPLVLWDSAEYRDIPSWGWARVRDMESGEDRSLFMRSELRERIRQSYAARRREIICQCRQGGTRMPFFVEDRFHAESLTRHLLEAS